MPSWAEGETAIDVAAAVLLDVHGVDVTTGDGALAWALYSEAARRLGFPGPGPVPQLVTATVARA